MTEPAEAIQLLLDEMFSPTIAERLRERGHKVVAMVEKPEMRSMSTKRSSRGRPPGNAGF